MTQRPKIPIKRRITCPKVRFCKKNVLVHCRSFEVLWRSEEVIWWPVYLKQRVHWNISSLWKSAFYLNFKCQTHPVPKFTDRPRNFYFTDFFVCVRIFFLYEFCTDFWNCQDFSVFTNLFGTDFVRIFGIVRIFFKISLATLCVPL